MALVVGGVVSAFSQPHCPSEQGENYLTGGLPIVMHEIGDATFWVDEDGIIKVDDSLNGVSRAAQRIGRKYLDPMVYRTVRS